MDIFGDVTGAPDSLDENEAFGLLRELEQNTPEEIRQQRRHFRLEIKATVTLQPGNTSDMLKFKMQGTTGDVSQSGCRILFPLAVRVGDLYRIEFDRAQLDLPMIFVRCVRCQFLREGAYDAGFVFLSPITLPRKLAPTANAARPG
jgi:c-di-GMP-binding flagellar brake protein YcgR